VLHIKTELGNRKISEPGQESPDLTNERKIMSTKTLRKRIALVAVSALGAGMLSLVAVPAANAGVAASSGALLGSTNVLDVLTNGGSYAAGNTIATSYSQGLVAGSVLGSTTTQTATMYSNGAITVATAATASSSGAAQKISVTG